jgi:S1-C subfamily serine protease
VIFPGNNKIPDGYKESMLELLYTIGTDRRDIDVSDDRKLRLVAIDNENDLALLEYQADSTKDLTDELRWISAPYNRTGKEDLGNKVFYVGYKLDMAKTLEEGIVSSKRTGDETVKDFFWTTLDSLPGISGSAVYEMDNGSVKLVGIATRISNSAADTLCIPISKVTDLMKTYTKNPGGEGDNVKSTMGDYYVLMDK